MIALLLIGIPLVGGALLQLILQIDEALNG
jgi:hypothetical protein